MVDWIFPFLVACIAVVFVVLPQRRAVGLERAIAIGSAVAALVTAVWLLLGCGSAPPATKVSPAQVDLMPMPWCASVLFTNGQARRGCAPTQELCEVDSEKIRQAGPIARIRWVGSCRRWP